VEERGEEHQGERADRHGVQRIQAGSVGGAPMDRRSPLR
jgi:hypothetical protein